MMSEKELVELYNKLEFIRNVKHWKFQDKWRSDDKREYYKAKLGYEFAVTYTNKGENVKVKGITKVVFYGDSFASLYSGRKHILDIFSINFVSIEIYQSKQWGA